LSDFLLQEGDPPREPDHWMRFLYGGTGLLDTTMRETREEFLR
jgi:hypothetical protein